MSTDPLDPFAPEKKPKPDPLAPDFGGIEVSAGPPAPIGPQPPSAHLSAEPLDSGLASEPGMGLKFDLELEQIGRAANSPSADPVAKEADFELTGSANQGVIEITNYIPTLPRAEPPPRPIPVADVVPAATPIPVADPVSQPGTVPEKKLPEWKVLEPADKADPVPHELCVCESRAPDWIVTAASVRGKLHAHRAGWREDAFAWGTVGDWTVLAVSDGAGSAKLSRIASKIICDSVVEELTQTLAGWTPAKGETQPAEPDLLRLRAFLEASAGYARRRVLSEAARRKASVNDFNATLLAVVHTPWHGKDLIAAIQVGDGAIGIRTADGIVVRLGIPDHGQFSSETKFLTTPGMELEYRDRVMFTIKPRVAALALMTDGVSDDFYPEDRRIGEVFQTTPMDGIRSREGNPLPGLMAAVAPDPRRGDALKDWLRYEKKGSSDDRTLVFMFRSRP